MRGLSVRCGLLALAGVCGVGVAAPRESVTFTSAFSEGELNAPENDVRTHAFVGGYTAYKFRLTGTLQSLEATTWRADARILVQTSGGTQFVLQPFTGGTFTSVNINDAVYDLAQSVPAGGPWTFRFYETSWDAGFGPDAVWNSVTFTLDDQGPAEPVTLTPVNNVYNEVEDNDRKDRANIIDAIVPGQRISGTTTGSASTAGPASADYFRVRTQAMPLGIYRHRLVITSESPGHTGAIRGRTQSGGVIDPASDIDVQSSSTISTPARMNQWYGFGKQERIYYRVVGSAATGLPYVASYTRDPVTPVPLATTFVPGAITITTIGQGYVSDTDLSLYDAQFNIVGGNDDWPGASGLSRFTTTLAPGEYYLAVGPYNVANDQASSGDSSLEAFPNGPVLDFPDALAQSTSLVDVNVGFTVIDSSGTHPFVARRPGSFDVYWAKLIVQGAATCAADIDDGSRTGTPDGAVTIDDLIYFLIAFEDGGLDADVDDGTRTNSPDGAVTIDDLIYFLVRFELGC